MVCNDECSLTFREQFQKDTRDPRIWFDPGTFGHVMDIDGHKVLGVFVRHVYDKQESGTEGYDTSSGTLYVRDRIRGVSAGQSIRVNGSVYVVKEYAHQLGAIWMIRLQAMDGE